MAGLLFSFATAAGCAGEPAYVGLVIEEATCAPGRCFIDDSLGAQAEVVAAFSAGWTARSLELVYPLDGAVQPINVHDLTVHWDPSGSSSSRFRLRLRAGDDSYDFYVPCLTSGKNEARGCSYRLPREQFGQAAAQFADRKVELALFGIAPSGRLVTAPPITLRFSPTALEGAFHYWSRSGTAHSLQRAVFGAERSVPLVTPPTEDNPNACGGCHGVSRQGRVIGYTLGEGDPDLAIETNAAFAGKLAVVDSARPDDFLIAPNAPDSDSAILAFNSDGTRVLTAFDRRLVLRDATDGASLYEVPPNTFGLNVSGFFPEFSPDDSQVVLVLSRDPAAGSDRAQEIAVTNGSIAIVDMEGDALAETPRMLVPEGDGLFHYYPTWSPDGRWIAFVSAEQDDQRDSYARSDARLRLVSVADGRVYELPAATGPADSSASWPRFAPSWQCPGGSQTCAPDERIFFFSLSSKRDYGYSRQNTLESEAEGTLAQLWLSTIDLGALGRGRDPSSPPLWIPYQEPFQRNYQGNWSAAAGCASDDACGPGARCVLSQCQTTSVK